jgi:hypothetical protein
MGALSHLYRGHSGASGNSPVKTDNCEARKKPVSAARPGRGFSTAKCNGAELKRLGSELGFDLSQCPLAAAALFSD